MAVPVLATLCAVLLAAEAELRALRPLPGGRHPVAGRDRRHHDQSAARGDRDVTTLTDSSVMDLIRDRLPTAPAEG
ncbi:hypothetical protein ODJ79_29475 [Actinoplanes sp. KI2]|uniref:hypothetical protein n=1 Tax=Actinoplanes sp. KI2 TaxID=2983315 RepID=UPI0021D604E2|nr:hypothetical protein [Actinoplanes sp. KI2]MCU7727868.1 hypothetical protein [Actinoplanes sp. KI2]